MKFLVSLACTLFVLGVQAQQRPTDLDKSPMDMSYWPNNYPLLKMSGKVKDMPVARVIYGRPLKNGRNIFGGILKYNEIWRLGANEATEVEFFTDVKIAGKPVSKGRYTLYCIPAETKWTIILNRDNFSWGNFSYDSKKDVLRTDIDVDKNTETVEAFTMYFDDSKTGTNLLFLWDDIKAALPVSAVVKK
ncbi:MAG: DUF2911 domain-containing protein [Bacteroidota bacterium]